MLELWKQIRIMARCTINIRPTSYLTKYPVLCLLKSVCRRIIGVDVQHHVEYLPTRAHYYLVGTSGQSQQGISHRDIYPPEEAQSSKVG